MNGNLSLDRDGELIMPSQNCYDLTSIEVCDASEIKVVDRTDTDTADVENNNCGGDPNLSLVSVSQRTNPDVIKKEVIKFCK